MNGKIYTIENELIKVDLGEEGGELFRIKGKINNVDFLWNGRKYGWPLSSPTLFPIIGKVKNNIYRINDNKFKMSQHGFASRLNHELIYKDDNSIEFQLKYCRKTLKRYPFKFILKSKYTLDNNTINIKFTVENIDNKDIIFTLGSHPTFICPLSKNEEVDNYYLEFNEYEECAKVLSITKDDFLTGEEKEYIVNNNKMFLSENTFKNGTLIFNNLKSNKVSLKCKNRSEYVTVDFSEFRYLSMWATENTKPFICIEPWLGHADYDDFEGDFREKEGNIILESGKVFACEYKIIINQ